MKVGKCTIIGVKHKWFAWYPVALYDNSIVWLEMVIRIRRVAPVGTVWQYHALDE